MRSPILRQRFLVRRWMARDVLAQATREESGKLVLERRCERCRGLHPASPLGADPGVWWSASNAGGLAAVAISNCRVGLDIEQDEPRPRRQRISRRFYTDAEQRAVAKSPGRFLEFWTMKEAFLKALGLGLPGGLRSIDCTTISGPAASWRTSPAHLGWRFRQLHPEPGFIGAIAMKGPADSIELRHWSPQAGEPW